jgi:hypothetical protein
MILRAKARKQQQSARQPFSAGIEELVYQVRLDYGLRDTTILKLHPDAVAIVRQPFAINHLPACRLFLNGSYHYVVTRLLGVFREQAAPCALMLSVYGLSST